MKKVAVIISIFCMLYACTHKQQIAIVTNPNTNNNNNNNNNNSDTTQETEVVDTSVCFARDVLPIFTGYCAMSGCHSVASAKKGYIFTDYAHIMANGVIAYRSSSSAAYADCVNGKMPKSPTPKLTGTQLSFMKRWIDQGAHNDTNCIVNCDTTKFTFVSAIVPILSKYCYSCHSTQSAATLGGGTILDSYSGVLAQVNNGKLLADLRHASGANYMPLGGAQLSDCKIIQFSKWIEAGAQNN